MAMLGHTTATLRIKAGAEARLEIVTDGRVAEIKLRVDEDGRVVWIGHATGDVAAIKLEESRAVTDGRHANN